MIPTARNCFVLVCNVVVGFDIYIFFVNVMSHQNQYQPDLCIRVTAAATAARGCDGRTGAHGAVSRFVPLFPLAIHTQSQGLYTQLHTFTHTHIASKSIKALPEDNLF